MKKLQLKVNSKYLSIQEGFEWKDIPNFSIITGVNGIGKTQLLQILKAERFKDFSIYDEEGNISRFFLASSHRQNLSIDGLLDYLLPDSGSINASKCSVGKNDSACKLSEISALR